MQLKDDRDALDARYKRERAEALTRMSRVGHKHTAKAMDAVCILLDDYVKFFQQGATMFSRVVSDIDEYKQLIAKVPIFGGCGLRKS